jgi:predicted ATPase
MDFIEIAGYKSIKKAHVNISPINILIGANGAGKSNFVSFFEFLNFLYEKKLTEYVSLNGGTEKYLHKGSKTTEEMSGLLSFGNRINEYSFTITPGPEHFIFTSEKLWYEGDDWEIANYTSEAQVKSSDVFRAKYVRNGLTSYRKYHFHETGKNSPFSKPSHIDNDKYYLYNNGDNLAAYLYNIRETHQKVYNRIISIIQTIAPFFSDFFLKANSEGYIRLQWKDKYSDNIYGVTDLSDGTIRFIALTTLCMQPDLPQTLIIDEPELGLHPASIAKLAGMIKSISQKGTQVIIATQSSDLVNYFEPPDIITVDQVQGESEFHRLKEEDLSKWLVEYTLGDLWKRNIIEGGQPNFQ